MRRLGVGLEAALLRAVVDDLLPLGPGPLLSGLDHLLLGVGHQGGRWDLRKVDGKVS